MNLEQALKSRTLIKLNHDAGYFDTKFESYCYSAVFSYKVIPEGKLLSLWTENIQMSSPGESPAPRS